MRLLGIGLSRIFVQRIDTGPFKQNPVFINRRIDESYDFTARRIHSGDCTCCYDSEYIGVMNLEFLKAFIVGGLICAIGQVLIDKTKLTPARILVIFVTSGVILTAIGLYEPIVKFGGAGATIPLTGFGYSLAKGAMKGVEESGLLGAFTGGISGTAGGIAGAVLFGYLIALIFSPKAK